MIGKKGQHTSFRGTQIDMESLRNENEGIAAVGNMGVNARGDKILHGLVTKTAEQMARENHRQRVIEKNTSLKGPDKSEEKQQVVKKKKEIQTPEGDIILKDEK